MFLICRLLVLVAAAFLAPSVIAEDCRHPLDEARQFERYAQVTAVRPIRPEWIQHLKLNAEPPAYLVSVFGSPDLSPGTQFRLSLAVLVSDPPYLKLHITPAVRVVEIQPGQNSFAFTIRGEPNNPDQQGFAVVKAVLRPVSESSYAKQPDQGGDLMRIEIR